MGFERNYQVKIHSKQINVSKSDNRAEGASSTDVNPWFISGLIDGEGSFSVIVDKNKTRKLGWRVQTTPYSTAIADLHTDGLGASRRGCLAPAILRSATLSRAGSPLRGLNFN